MPSDNFSPTNSPKTERFSIKNKVLRIFRAQLINPQNANDIDFKYHQ